MSVTAALSLAGTALRSLNCLEDIISLYKDICAGNSPNDRLDDCAKALGIVTEELQRAAPETDIQKELVKIARKCHESARALEKSLEPLIISTPGQSRRMRAALTVAWRTSSRLPQLQKHEKTLQNYQNTLVVVLLVRFCSQQSAQGFQQTDRFNELDASGRRIIEALAEGQAGLRQLINSRELWVKNVISQEASQIEETIKEHVTNTATTTQAAVNQHISMRVDEAAGRIQDFMSTTNSREKTNEHWVRLLESLKYPRMNERHNCLCQKASWSNFWKVDSIPLRHSTSCDDRNRRRGFIRTEPTAPKDDTRELTPPRTPGNGSEQEGLDENNEQLEGVSRDDEYDPMICLRCAAGHSDESDSKSTCSLLKWLQSDSNIFWISGKPGAGKSTLVRYVVGDKTTMEALKVWCPEQDVMILSHFLWKPGSPMQRNQKGLLCSLLYQLLLHDASMIMQCNIHGIKDEPADWSLAELKVAFFVALQKAARHTCIFLDGLDEVSSEDGGIRGLLDLVRDLRAVPNLKICVSSRSEEIFKMELGKHQQLFVHDLTAPDMLSYIRDSFKEPWERGNIGHSDRRRLVYALLSKAEGVFLWLRLVVQSLEDGLDNRDSYEDLHRRIDELPSELATLYGDMWERRNGKTGIYRETSAFYLNMILSFNGPHGKGEGYKYSTMTIQGIHDICVYAFAAATCADKSAGEAFAADPRLHAETLGKFCHKFQSALLLRCAGIVQILPIYPAFVWADEDEFGLLLGRFFQIHVDVIHRSAYDFLKETDLGQRILSYDKSTPDYRRVQISRGALATARAHAYYDSYVFFAVYSLEPVREIGLQKDVHDLLQACWKFYEDCQTSEIELGFPPDGYSYTYRRHFLLFLALPSPIFQEFMVSSIRRDAVPSALATLILRDFFPTFSGFEEAFTFDGHDGVSCTLETLLNLGADINCRGIVETGFTLGPDLEHVPINVPVNCPLGTFLKEAVTAPSGMDGRYIQHCLALFSTRKPSLSERTHLRLHLMQYSSEISSEQWWCVGQARVQDLTNTAPKLFGTSCSLSYEIAVDVNLAFLWQLLVSRSHFQSQQTIAQDILAEHRPWVRVRFVLCSLRSRKGMHNDRCFRVENETTSERLIQIIQPLLTATCWESQSQQQEQLAQLLAADICAGTGGESPSYRQCDDIMDEPRWETECGYVRVSALPKPGTFSMDDVQSLSDGKQSDNEGQRREVTEAEGRVKSG